MIVKQEDTAGSIQELLVRLLDKVEEGSKKVVELRKFVMIIESCLHCQSLYDIIHCVVLFNAKGMTNCEVSLWAAAMTTC